MSNTKTTAKLIQARQRLARMTDSLLLDFIANTPKSVLSSTYGFQFSDSDKKHQEKIAKYQQFINSRLPEQRPVIQRLEEQAPQLYSTGYDFASTDFLTKPIDSNDVWEQQKQESVRNATKLGEQYNAQLSELKEKRDRLSAQRKQYIDLTSSSMSGPDQYGSMSRFMTSQDEHAKRLENLIKELDQQINKLTTEKNRAISTYEGYTNPNLLSHNKYLKTMYNSDDMVKLNANYTEEMQAGLDLAENDEWFGVKKWFPTGDQRYKNQYQKIIEARDKRGQLSDKYNELIEYLNHIRKLPNSIEEFPEKFRQIAQSAFTQNGKLLLTDPEFRKSFYEDVLIDDDKLKLYADVAKEVARIPENSLETLNQLSKAKQEILLLSDLNYIANPNKLEYSGNYAQGFQFNKDIKSPIDNYRSALDLIEKAEDHQRLYDEIVANNAGAFHAGRVAFREFFLNNADTYTFGMYGLHRDIRTLGASNKLRNGQKLDASEEALLRAQYLENAMHGQFGAYEERDAYKWSNIAAESLQFMAEFIATGGWLKSIQATGRALAEGAVKSAAKLAARKVVAKSMGTTAAKIALDNPAVEKLALELVEKYGRTVSSVKLLNGATRLGADATYAALLTNTLGLPKTLDDAVNSARGDIKAYTDNNGDIRLLGIEGGMDFGKALWQAEKRNWIENFSEMMGEWGIGKGIRYVGKKLPGFNKLVNRIEGDLVANEASLDVVKAATQYAKYGLGRVNSLMSQKGLSRFIPNTKNIFNKQIFKAGQFHGFPGEISEEYYGLVLQHMLGVLDDPNANLWLDILNQSADIWGGIAVSSGLMGSFGMISNLRTLYRHQRRVNDLRAAFGDKVAEEILKKLIFSDLRSIHSITQLLIDEYGLRPKKKGAFDQTVDLVKSLFGKGEKERIDKGTALLEYANSLIQYRSDVYGEDLIKKYVGESLDTEKANAAKLGYSNASYRTINQALSALDIMQKQTEDVFADTSIQQLIEDYKGNISDLKNAIKSGKVKLNDGVDTIDAINTMISYVNLLNFKNGADLHLNDILSERARKQGSIALRLAHIGNNENKGLIRRILIPVKNEKGEIETNENGEPTGKTQSLFWIDGDIRTKLASDEIETDEKSYEKGSDYILVADQSGYYSYIKRSELKGAKIDPHAYDVKKQQEAFYNHALQEEQNMRDMYLQRQFGINPEIGAHLYANGKKVTILDANPARGITYSVSEEDGKNAKIYHLDNVQELNQLVNQMQAEEGKELTDYFNERAKRLNNLDETAEARTKQAMELDKRHRFDVFKKRQAQDRKEYMERDGVVDENDERDDSDAYFPSKHTTNSNSSKKAQTNTNQRKKSGSKKRFSVNDHLTARDRKTINNLRDLMKKMRRNAYGSILPIQPLADLALGIAVAGIYLKAGLKTFVEYAQEILRQYGKEYENVILDNLKSWTEAAAENLNNLPGNNDAEKLAYRDAFIDDMNNTDINEISTPQSLTLDASISNEITESTTRDGEVVSLIEEIGVTQAHKIATSGFHYFVMYNGKLRLARRVHSIIGDRYENTPDNKASKERLAKYYQRLSAVNSDDLKSEVEKIVNEIYDLNTGPYDIDTRVGGMTKDHADLVQRELNMSLLLDNYIKYLQENQSEKAEVIKGLSEILSNTSNTSVITGNIYDQLCKIILDCNTEIVPDYDDEMWTILFYGEPTHIRDVYTYVDREGIEKPHPLMTRAAFEAAVKQIIEIKKYYAKQGIKIVSNTSYFHFAELYVGDSSNTMSKVLVAGESDAIGITEDGNRVLIDFKTYYHAPVGGKRYYKFYIDDRGHTSPSEFFKIKSASEEKSGRLRDPFTGEVDINKSQAAQYARQLAVYKLLHAQNGHLFLSSQVLLIGVNYQFLGRKSITIDEVGERANISMSAFMPENIDENEYTPVIVNMDQAASDVDSEDAYSFSLELNDLYAKVQNVSRDEKLQLILKITDVILNTEGRNTDLDRRIEEFNQKVSELSLLDTESMAKDEVENLVNTLEEERLHLLDEIETDIQNSVKAQELEKKLSEVLSNVFINAEYGDFNELTYILTQNVIGHLISRMHNIQNDAENSIEDVQEFLDYCSYLEYILQLHQLNPSVNIANEQILAARQALSDVYRTFPEFGKEIRNGLNYENIPDRHPNSVKLFIPKKYWQYTNLSDHAENSKNILDSIAEDGTKLTSVLKKPNFINEAKFTVRRIETKNPNRPTFEMIIEFDGRTYSPVTIFFAKQPDINGNLNPNVNTQSSKNLYHDLCEATEHNNEVVIDSSAIRRSIGVAKNSEEAQTVTVSWLSEHAQINNWSEVKYEQNGKFGLTKVQKIDGRPYVVAMTPGDETGDVLTRSRVREFVYTRQNEDVHPPIGGIVMFYTPQYNETEKTGEQLIFPVNLESQLFSEDYANLIIDLLHGQYSGRDANGVIQPNVPVQIGNRVLPFTNRELLSMFISLGYDNLHGNKQPVSLLLHPNGTVLIRGVMQGVQFEPDQQEFISRPYNMVDENDRLLFKEFLMQNVRMNISEVVMKQQLGKNSIFSEMSKWFANNDTKQLKLGNVTIITQDELDSPQNQLTGLGYYMKRGFLKTTFQGTESPLMRIEESEVDLKNIEETSPIDDSAVAPVVEKANLEDLSLGEDDYDEDEVHFNHEVNQAQIEQLKAQGIEIEEELARQIIKDICGDVDVEFQNDVLAVSGDSVVLGACYRHVIKLSRMARTGVAYHEAFHRVLELLVSDKLREKAYKEYRKKFGKDLTDLEIAELAADDFWWYMEHKPEKFKFSWNIGKMLKQLVDWYRFFTKIGSFTLWKLYRNTAAGKYKNSTPSKDTIARWNRVAKKGYFAKEMYQIMGLRFSTILNHREFDAVTETVRMIAVDPGTYKDGKQFDRTGKHFEEITMDMLRYSDATKRILSDTSINRQDKLKLLEYLDIDVAGGEIVRRKHKDESKGNHTKDKELLEYIVKNLRRSLMNSGKVIETKLPKDAVEAMLGREQSKSEGSITENTSDTDLADDGENYGADAVADLQSKMGGEFTKVSAEFEPITRASARVKLFFSLIADYENVEICENGKAKIVSRPRKNAAGLPLNIDFKLAWGMMLNYLYQCRTPKDIYEKLDQIRYLNPSFNEMFKSYHNLLIQAYETREVKDGSGKVLYKTVFTEDGGMMPEKRAEYVGIVNEITSVLNHAKNIPLVLQFMNNDRSIDTSKSVRVFEASLEYKCRQMRRSWSAHVSSGQGLIVSKDNKGNYHIKDKILLMKTANWIDDFLNFVSGIPKLSDPVKQKGFKLEIDDGVLSTTPTSNEIRLDVTNENHLAILCNEFVKKLNILGISILAEDFNHMLSQRYGKISMSTLKKFCSDFQLDINEKITSFLNIPGKDLNYSACAAMLYCGNTITTVKIVDGRQQEEVVPIVPKKTIDRIFNNSNNNKNNKIRWSSFIDAIAKSRFDRQSNELLTMYITIGGKKQFSMSEPNYITDTIDHLTDEGSEDLLKRLNDLYYASSMVLNQIDSQSTMVEKKQLLFHPVPGFKSDLIGSQGVEYLDLSEKEDYACKYGLLAAGHIILPTLSDKTTWGSVFSPLLKVFGIDYVSKWEASSWSSMKNYFNGYYETMNISDIKNLRFNDEVVTLFIKYAKSEYDSARRELNRLTNFSDSKSVQNLDFCKEKNVHQAARLSTFTGIIKEDGTFVSFNDSSKTDKECLDIAEREFFNQEREVQVKLMNRILAEQVSRELQKLEYLNMVSVDGNYYVNKALDRPKIGRIKNIISGISNNNEDKDVPVHAELDAAGDHRAIVAYVADMVIKNQMSMQESFRLFGLDPRSYKWRYASLDNEHPENGRPVIDATTDQFKRLGGLASTGAHNVPNVQDVEEDIVCAEWKDTHSISTMFGSFFNNASVQQLVKHVRATIFDTTVVGKDVAGNQIIGIGMDNEGNFDVTIKSLNEELLSLAKEDLDYLNSILEKLKDLVNIDGKKRYEKLWEHVKDLKLVKKLVDVKVRNQGFDEKRAIDFVKFVLTTEFKKNEAFYDYTVTDGFTLITPNMTRKLLKQIGKWDDHTENAFMRLEGYVWKNGQYVKSENATYTNEELRGLAEAYNQIYTAIIGTQKYTSYGLREEEGKYIDEQGNEQTYIRLITYFEKTAYFPMFSCMASGYLKAVLKKAEEDGIDVLRSNESMKVGGGMTTPMNEDTLKQWDSDPESYKNYHFKTYIQKMSNVRKQFNTDPKEQHKMSLGTQYVKVLMSLIEPGQKYKLRDASGNEMSAKQTRDYVMNCIKKICEAGTDDFKSRFYDKNGNVNLNEFVKLLRAQLSDKDANDQIIQALEVESVPDPNNPGQKMDQFYCPISCMSSTSWIESIVTSVVNKYIVDINTPGHAFYQRSAFAMEGMMQANWLDVEDFDYVINHGAELQEVNEEGSMDIVLSIDYFDYLWEGTALEHQSFEAKKAWLIKHGIISGFAAKPEEFEIKKGDVFMEDGKIIEIKDENDSRIGTKITAIKWHNATANIVGYRIPTQAVSSIHALRCVDVIPVVRDTVILPKEITAVTGSDFDIDKFFLSTLYYRNEYTESGIELVNELANRLGFNSFDELKKHASQVKRKIDNLEAKELEAVAQKSDLTDDEKTELSQAKSELLRLNKELKGYVREDGTVVKGEEQIWRENNYLNQTFDENGDAYERYKHWANKLLRAQIDLLRTTGNNISQLHGSIDSDTKPLKETANELRENETLEYLMPFEMTSLRTNISAKINFAVGKKGIGPFALNNNNHVYTMLYGVKFKSINKEEDILRALGLQSLAKRFDRDGRDIMSWLSGLINGHVDVAKDPYIRTLGVNSYSYNLVNLLIRTGYGIDTFWFLTQPIMKQIYKAHDDAAGIYNLDDPEIENKSVFARTQLATQNALVQFINNHITDSTYTQCNSYNAAINSFKQHLKSKYSIDPKNFLLVVKQIMLLPEDDKPGSSVMKRIAKTPEDQLDYSEKINLGGGLTLTIGEIQATLGIANFMLLAQALNLSKLVQYTKVDTKKYGITIGEHRQYMRNFKKLYVSAKSSPFEFTAVKKMIEDSFIEQKTNAATSAVNDLMSGQLIQATKGYSTIEQALIDELGQERDGNKFRESIQKMIISKIKLDYFLKGPNSYCIRRGINPKWLFVTEDKALGLNSLYDELEELKAKIQANPKLYSSLIDKKTGLCNNYLLLKLIRSTVVNTSDLYEEKENMFVHASQIQDAWNGAKFITIDNSGEDAIKGSDLQNAWEDLLNDSQHPDVQRFAERLVVYSFLTGTTGGGMDMSTYVPISWVTGNCAFLRSLYRDLHTGQSINKGTFADYMNNMIRELNKVDSEGHSAYNCDWSQLEKEEMIMYFAWDDNLVQSKDKEIFKTIPSFRGTIDQAVQGNSRNPILFGAISGNRALFKDDDKNFPRYLKFQSNIKGAVGQVRYDYYKLVQYGIRNGEKYPIYALIKPQGGFYSGGQKIMAIGSQVIANDKYDFRQQWISPCAELLKMIKTDKNMVEDPSEIFAKLFNIIVKVNRRILIQAMEKIGSIYGVGNSLVDSMILMPDGVLISGLVEDVIEYEKDSIDQVYDDPNDHKFDLDEDDYNNAVAQGFELVEYKSASTNLNIDKTYTPDKEAPLNTETYSTIATSDNTTTVEKEDFDTAAKLFNYDQIQYIQNTYGMHIEFHKIQYRGDNNYFKIAMTISLPYRRAKGFILINVDVDPNTHQPNGTYDIQFKTYSTKMRGNIDAFGATVPLNTTEKVLLFRAMLMAIPNEALISVSGEITKGALNAIEHLDQIPSDLAAKKRFNLIHLIGAVLKVDEKTVILKTGFGKKATTEEVKVPVWQKSVRYESLYISNTEGTPTQATSGDALVSKSETKSETDLSWADPETKKTIDTLVRQAENGQLSVLYLTLMAKIKPAIKSLILNAPPIALPESIQNEIILARSVIMLADTNSELMCKF